MVALMTMTVLGVASAGENPPGQSDAHLYVGAGLGMTHLSTEFANAKRSLITDTPPSGSVFVGVDLSPHISIEASATVADSAAVGQDGRVIGDYAYRDYGVSALTYLYRQEDGKPRSGPSAREGLSAFARLGAGYKDPDSALASREARHRHLTAGFGAEYGWPGGVGARAEVTFMDNDARQLQVSLLKRFEMGAPAFGARKKANAGDSPEQIWSNRFYIHFPTLYFSDNDPRSPLGREDQRRLDELAKQLLRAPGLEIEVRGHADSLGGLREALSLSRRRAITVSRYLQSKGIRGNRLHIRAYGNSDPVLSPDGQPAPARNRRVDFAIFSPHARKMAARK